MNRYIDITGRRFGRMVALKVDHVKQYKPRNRIYNVEYWLCKCDCGKQKIVTKNTLLVGKTLSCGCYNKDKQTKHGKSKTRLYNIWSHILDRCENQNSKEYRIYGGRGIKVCEEWHDLDVFFEWALANGYDDNLTIDRINVNGNYKPSNCRWATRKTQNNNTRRNHVIEYNGERKTLAQWSEILGIDYKVLTYRIHHGWSTEKAFTTETTPAFIEYNGEKKLISEWSKITGIKPSTIRRRYLKGLCAEKIFEKRVKKCGYIGVTYTGTGNRYRAIIMIKGKNKHLGCFSTEEEAHKAYCEAKKELHGEFARLA